MAQIGISVIKDLEILHDKGFVHGDMKPDNILINYNWTPTGCIKADQFEKSEEPKLIDFGMASKYLDVLGNHIELKYVNRT